MTKLTDEQIERLYDELDFTEDEKIVSAEYDEDTHDIEIEYISVQYGEDYPLMYMASFPVDDSYACERFEYILNGDGPSMALDQDELDKQEPKADSTPVMATMHEEKTDTEATASDPRNYEAIAKWIKDEIKTLKENNSYVGGFYKLDDTFAIVMAWEEGFDPKDTDLIHDKEGSDWALCIGIRYINEHDTCDYWDFPVDKESGYLICESSSLPSEDKIDDDFLLATAKWLIADYERACENEDLINDEDHLDDLKKEDNDLGMSDDDLDRAKGDLGLEESKSLTEVDWTYSLGDSDYDLGLDDLQDADFYDEQSGPVWSTLTTIPDIVRGFVNNAKVSIANRRNAQRTLDREIALDKYQKVVLKMEPINIVRDNGEIALAAISLDPDVPSAKTPVHDIALTLFNLGQGRYCVQKNHGRRYDNNYRPASDDLYLTYFDAGTDEQAIKHFESEISRPLKDIVVEGVPETISACKREAERCARERQEKLAALQGVATSQEANQSQTTEQLVEAEDRITDPILDARPANPTSANPFHWETNWEPLSGSNMDLSKGSTQLTMVGGEPGQGKTAISKSPYDPTPDHYLDLMKAAASAGSTGAVNTKTDFSYKVDRATPTEIEKARAEIMKVNANAMARDDVPVALAVYKDIHDKKLLDFSIGTEDFLNFMDGLKDLEKKHLIKVDDTDTQGNKYDIRFMQEYQAADPEGKKELNKAKANAIDAGAGANAGAGSSAGAGMAEAIGNQLAEAGTINTTNSNSTSHSTGVDYSSKVQTNYNADLTKTGQTPLAPVTVNINDLFQMYQALPPEERLIPNPYYDPDYEGPESTYHLSHISASFPQWAHYFLSTTYGEVKDNRFNAIMRDKQMNDTSMWAQMAREALEQANESSKADADNLNKVKGTYSKELSKVLKEINEKAQDESVSFEELKAFVLDSIKDAWDTDAKKGFINSVNKLDPKGGYSKAYGMVVDGKINLAALCMNATLRADKSTRLVGDRWANEKDEGLKSMKLTEEINLEASKEKFNDLNKWEYSDEAVRLVDNILNNYDLVTDDDVRQAVWEEVDNAFIYYADAWDYLKQSGVTDFEEPVKEGFTGITQIAVYYCEQEVYEILGKIDLW